MRKNVGATQRLILKIDVISKELSMKYIMTAMLGILIGIGTICPAEEAGSLYEGRWIHTPLQGITGTGLQRKEIHIFKIKNEYWAAYASVAEMPVKDKSGKRSRRIRKRVTTEYRNLAFAVSEGSITFVVPESGEVLTLKYAKQEGKALLKVVRSVNKHGVVEPVVKGLEEIYYKEEGNQ